MAGIGRTRKHQTYPAIRLPWTIPIMEHWDAESLRDYECGLYVSGKIAR